MLKQLVTYFLLASFAVLLSPRGIWHECEHDHEHVCEIELSVDNDNHDFEQTSPVFEEDCYACDFDLGYFTATKPSFSALLKRIHSNAAVEILNRLSDNKGHSISLRGPPVTA